MVVIFLVPVLVGVGARAGAPAPAFYVDRGADGRCRSSVIPVAAGTAGDAGAREHLSGAARARHPDADGPAVRGEPRHAAALHPARAAAAGRVAARRHRLLRDAAVADHADAAVVLGRRDAVRQPAGRTRSGCTSARCGRRRWRRSSCSARRSERWHFAGFSQVAGGAEGALHAAARRSTLVAAALPLSHGAAAAAGQGPEGVPARRQPVVAAPAAARAGAASISTTSACSISNASRT